MIYIIFSFRTNIRSSVTYIPTWTKMIYNIFPFMTNIRSPITYTPTRTNMIYNIFSFRTNLRFQSLTYLHELTWFTISFRLEQI